MVPPILVAALRPGMLRLAGREGDGAHYQLARGSGRTEKSWPRSEPAKEIVARIFVCPSEDIAAVRAVAQRRMIAELPQCPCLRGLPRVAGARRGSSKRCGRPGRPATRKAALEAIPDEVVDDLVLHGSPAQVRAQVQQYMDAGVTTAALAVVGFGLDRRETVRHLAPTA